MREAIERPILRDEAGPADLRVVQITTDRQCASCHIYMESAVFTPDSRCFVYSRYRRPDPEFAAEQDLMLCDLRDGFALRQLTDEPHVRAPSMMPDGSCVVYFVAEGTPGDSRIQVKRVMLDSFRSETLLVLDSPPAGLDAVPSRLYPLSSISVDGRRVCAGAFLGDGETESAPWGVLVFDLETLNVSVALSGPEYCNTHPQYGHGHDNARDVLVQHNHGSRTDPDGTVSVLWSGTGADVHVVRDDGTDFRDLPWGRDGSEYCQGHQCWRGTMNSAVASMFPAGRKCVCGPLVEAVPVRCDEHHLGRALADAPRNEISRGIAEPAFSHFAFDPNGTRFVSDWIADETRWEDGRLVIGSLGPAPGATLRVRHLLSPRTPYDSQTTHPHPFLSPDGTKVFFNSSESGRPQIYMAEGFEFP